MNSYQIVEDFEKAVAEYSNCNYAISVDSCTNAIFLCLKYLNVSGTITIPKETYPSVPCSIIHAGAKVNFIEHQWKKDKFYQLSPYPIYDAAHLFENKMFDLFKKNSFVCISFSSTKPINIGKGGMILTNEEKAKNWFKKARYCGRNEKPLLEDNFEVLGWNFYMTPEQAARGMQLLYSRDLRHTIIPNYPDLSKFEIYK